MIRASRRRWFLLTCTSLTTGAAACGQTTDAPEEKLATSQQAIASETSFAIYASNSMSIGSEVHVTEGRVGVRRVGQGPSLTPGYEIAIGTAAVVSTTNDVNADSLLLQAGATLGAIHANDVVDNGSNHGPISPFGPMPSLPILPKSFPGTTSLLVPANATLPIAANGRYDVVVVGDKATLRLAGGVYHIASLTLGAKSRLEADAPTVLRIAGRLASGEKSFIGPSGNGQQVVLNMRIEVDGKNGGVGGVTDLPPAVLFGAKSDVRAIVYATNGTLTFAEKSDAIGAFYGRDIKIDPKVNITTIDRGDPASFPCTFEQCTIQPGPSGQKTTICVRAPVPAGTSCANGDLCDGDEVCNGNGSCLAGTPVDDGNPCTTCDGLTGTIIQVPLPFGRSCDDGNVCNGIETCNGNAACVPGIPLNGALINDGDLCTTDTCDPLTGPVHTPVNVDDGNPNTMDWCEPIDGGIVHSSCAPLDPTVPTQIKDSMRCVYDGAPPRQVEIPQPLDPVTLAAVHGKVVGLDGLPLSGVKVRVLGSPGTAAEPFGHTYTLPDGGYAMVLRGGESSKLVFEKQGYLAVHRVIEVKYQQDLPVEEVILRNVDAQATPILLNGITTGPTIQVARGSVQTDHDGTRQATMMFAPNTTATMTILSANGVPTTSLMTGSLTVRATEFTVGDNGPLAMPATLPPTTGYTYAVELSIDEAVQAGATRVDFTNPVSFYLENFLGMPVGTQVPLGYYDRTAGQWVPDTDGRVIQIVGIDADGAVVDTGQSGIILPLDERARLAALYAIGTTLWRVQLKHFSVVDLNYPQPPGDACAPDDADCPLGAVPEGPNNEDEPCEQSGSIIECENQILGERIPVAGTPYTLNYRSDRAVGRKDTYKIRVPYTGPKDLPGVLQVIAVRLEVAGRSMGKNFTNPADWQKNARVDIEWDGKDADGNFLHGAQTAKVSVGYGYNPEYGLPLAQTQSFGAPSLSLLSGIPGRRFITKWKDWYTTIGAFTAESTGLGGFTLDRHHVYDPIGRVLHRGDGSRVSARVSPATIELKALASNNNPWFPRSIVVLPDGTIAFSAVGTPCKIWRLAADGSVTALAGNGSCQSSGDGGPALQASFTPEKLAVGPDGSIYISEVSANYRVRRILPNGNIVTVAGNGPPIPGNYPVEGAQATQTYFPALGDVAVTQSGDIFVVNGLKVYRIATSGQVTRFAGGGNSAYPAGAPFGTIPATSIAFGLPSALASAPDGTLYIADANENAVYHVGLDGTIYKVPVQVANPNAITVGVDGTVYVTHAESNKRPVINAIVADTNMFGIAGVQQSTCSAGSICGMNGPALAASLFQVRTIAAGPDGSVWVGDSTRGVISRVRPSMPFVSAGFYEIMNGAGTEIYTFDPSGRHQTTKDARTGALIESFGYDPKGRLIQITDGDGLVTHIDHDPQTNAPTQLTGPFQHVTQFGVDGHGYLNSVTNPANEHITMTYTPGAGPFGTGLLQQWIDAKNQAHTFEYESETGRLSKDTNPALGFKTLVKTKLNNGYSVDLSTAGGRLTKYEVTTSAGGAKLRAVTPPSGVKSQQSVFSNGDRLMTFSDQTTVTTTPAGDPRFGLQAPIAAVETTVSGSHTRLIERSREVTMVPNQPLNLQSQVDRVKINGDEFVTTFTAASGIEETVTPEGRHITRHVDTKGRVVSEQLADLAPVEYVYDNQGQLEQILWGGRIWDPGYAANGQLSSITNPLFEMTNFVTDAIGRVTSETNANLETTTTGYDNNGNTDQVTPAGQPLHEMAYTPTDRLASYTAPSVNGQPSQTTWTYDVDGYRDLVTLPGGSVIDYTPDAAGRPGTITLPGAEGTISFGYDATTGHLSSLNGPMNVNLVFGYNGRLLTDQTWSGIGPSITVHHDHDNAFRVVNETINGGSAATFQHDKDGLLTFAGPMQLLRTPKPGKQPTGLLEGSTAGVVVDDYERNTHGEVTQYKALVNGVTLLDVLTPRDVLGRIDTRTEVIGAQTTAIDYVYDAAGRLQDVKDVATNQLVTHYDYDANGNRLARTSTSGTETGTYDAQDRLSAYGGRAYTYTLAGSLATMTNGNAVTSYTYDAMGGLRRVVKPNGDDIQYVLDGAGRRVWKKRNGALVQGFVYADGLRPVAELNGAGQVVARFIYGRHVNVPDVMIKNGTTYRIVTDHLGSPRFVVNTATGAIAQTMTYDEFGRVLSDSAPGFQPFGFAGGIYDTDTELVRFGARDYDAFAGRWTAKDPIRFDASGFNLYNYALGDPVNIKDENGLIPHSAHVISPEDQEYIDNLQNRMNITPEPPELGTDPKCQAVCLPIMVVGVGAVFRGGHPAIRVVGAVSALGAFLILNSKICEATPMTNTYTPR